MTAGSRPSPDLSWTEVLAAARDDAAISRVRDLIRVCETVINRAGLTAFNSMGTPRKDAEALVFETLAIRDHSDRYLDAVVTAPERALILDRLERRVSEPIPVPYIIGEAFFAGRRFTVKPGVFVPRSALGHLLDEVIAGVQWSTPPRLLEIGCGTGALAISFATRLPEAVADLVDIDELAVEVAGHNVDRHRLSHRARVFVSDMFSTVDPTRRYDLIVANLPYVPEEQAGRTATGEIHAEPPGAIFRPGDGLDLVRAALAEAPLHLAESGTLILEVGTAHVDDVSTLLGGRGRWSKLGERNAGVVTLTRDELKA